MRSKNCYRVSKIPNPEPDLWVISCHFNPCKYKNRRINYNHFAKNLRQQGVPLLVVELCYQDGQNDLDPSTADIYVQVVESDVLWAKERLLNIALENLPATCTKVCWVDADILFKNANWAICCSEMLEEYPVVQPYDFSVFLGPHDTPARKISKYKDYISFAHYYRVYGPPNQKRGLDVTKSHPGYAWAARRETLNQLGGFYDKCILGQGDLVMALGFAHNLKRDGPLPPGPQEFPFAWKLKLGPKLTANGRIWQQRAAEIVQGEMGCLDGTVYHLWHGEPKDRMYNHRNQFIADFDPDTDIMLNPKTSLWQWTRSAKQRKMDKKCEMYFKLRNEDKSTRS